MEALAVFALRHHLEARLHRLPAGQALLARANRRAVALVHEALGEDEVLGGELGLAVAHHLGESTVHVERASTLDDEDAVGAVLHERPKARVRDVDGGTLRAVWAFGAVDRCAQGGPGHAQQQALHKRDQPHDVVTHAAKHVFPRAERARLGAMWARAQEEDAHHLDATGARVIDQRDTIRIALQQQQRGSLGGHDVDDGAVLDFAHATRERAERVHHRTRECGAIHARLVEGDQHQGQGRRVDHSAQTMLPHAVVGKRGRRNGHRWRRQRVHGAKTPAVRCPWYRLRVTDTPLPPRGLALHFDLRAGVRGDLLVGALLDLGLPETTAQRALVDVGLAGVSLDVTRVHRHGLAATQVVLRALEEPLADGALSPLSVRPRRPHRLQQPHRDRAVVVDERAQDPALVTRMALAVEGRSDANAGKKLSKRGRTQVAAVVDAWLKDGVSTSTLLAHARTTALSPVAKAWTMRALMRLTEARTRLERSAGDDVILDGATAIRALAECAMVAALVEQLSPARVTASEILLSPDDDTLRGAWACEAALGAPVVELERPYVSTSPIGAALVTTLAHRFGPRALSVQRASGSGACALDVADHAFVVRALLGDLPPVATRAGASLRVPSSWLHVILPLDVDVSALRAACVQHGAHSASLVPTTSLDQTLGMRFEALVGSGDVDAFVRALWQAGADVVTVVPAEQRAPGVHTLTVSLGSGKSATPVRVRIMSDDVDLLRVEAIDVDVRKAAANMGISVRDVRAQALHGATELWGQKNRARDGGADD